MSLNIIDNNPYRFLGVYSNSSTKVRLSNINKMKAYLKVGKKVEFPSDMTNLLSSIKRDLNKIDETTNSINQPQDQLKYALFWFINFTNIDKIALDHAITGNIDKAYELLQKKETFSSLINLGILSFIQGNNGDAINYITRVIHEYPLRLGFVEAICGNTQTISEKDLAKLFVDSLSEELSVKELADLFKQYGVSSNDYDILKDKLVDEHINTIYNAINQANSINKSNPENSYRAGIRLINSTKPIIQDLKRLLSINDLTYQKTIDNLANRILQCGIDYYNDSNEDEETTIDKTLKIAYKANEIAVGQLVKERCEDTINTLNDNKLNIPLHSIQNELKQIDIAVDNFKNPQQRNNNSSDDFINIRPVTVDIVSNNKYKYQLEAVSTLIDKTEGPLLSIKQKLYDNQELYLTISTNIASLALNKIIDVVNSSQKSLNDHYSSSFGSPFDSYSNFNRRLTITDLSSLLNSSISLMERLASFGMKEDFRSHFNSQKSTLVSMKNQLGSAMVNYYNNYNRPKQQSSSGCMVALCSIVILTIISLIM